MTAELKKFLIEVYSKSTLTYGLENTFMYSKDYKDLDSLESRIMKNAIGLNKYHSTTLLNAALNITPISHKIKTLKLKFLIRLSKYPLTKAIIEELNANKSQIHHQSILKETSPIMKNKTWTDTETFKTICEQTISDRSKEEDQLKNTETAQTINYLLNSRKPEYMNAVRRLLHWQHSKETKRYNSKG